MALKHFAVFDLKGSISQLDDNYWYWYINDHIASITAHVDDLKLVAKQYWLDEVYKKFERRFGDGIGPAALADTLVVQFVGGRDGR